MARASMMAGVPGATFQETMSSSQLLRGLRCGETSRVWPGAALVEMAKSPKSEMEMNSLRREEEAGPCGVVQPVNRPSMRSRVKGSGARIMVRVDGKGAGFK